MLQSVGPQRVRHDLTTEQHRFLSQAAKGTVNRDSDEYYLLKCSLVIQVKGFELFLLFGLVIPLLKIQTRGTKEI